MLNKNAVFVKGNLNISQMQQCANILLGQHNYKSFCNLNNDTKTFIRTIKNINITRQNELIEIYITADGFLYNMVRVLVGTLIECGKLNLNQTDLKTLLQIKDRSKNPAKTMVSKGLLLYSVQLNN